MSSCSSSDVVKLCCLCFSAEQSATSMLNFFNIVLLGYATEMFVAYQCIESSNVCFSSCVIEEYLLDIRRFQSSSVGIPFLRFVRI